MSNKAISADYYGILHKAEELEELAGRLMSLADDDISEKVDVLRRSWSGDSGELYVTKVNDTAGRLRSRARELRKLSFNLRKSAERMRAAELYAMSILRGR